MIKRYKSIQKKADKLITVQKRKQLYVLKYRSQRDGNMIPIHAK